MTDLFLEVINRSINAGWLVLVIAALRPMLKKTPKWIHVLLWGIVAFRLLCPVTLESAYSLLPSSQTIPEDIMMAPIPTIDSGVSSINQVVNPILAQSFTPNPAASANPLQIWLPIGAAVWCVGMAVMGLYTAISYLRLRRKVATAVIIGDNIYQSEAVASPFLLGLLRPRIYLPFVLSSEDMAHVIAHEQMHIRRKDHWWKPLGFILLTITWFHPLMWMAYILLCRDIELACDEAAVKNLSPLERADYSQALLDQSIRRRTIAACPLAFGEVGVKQRVKNVLHYKKPAFWVVVLGLVLCMVVAFTFLTDPHGDVWLDKLHSLKNGQITTIFHEEVQGSQSLGATFYTREHQNLHRILPILNKAAGTPIPQPLLLWNEEKVDLITIFLDPSLWGEEAKFYNVRIINDQYLVIEDHWYEADSSWLATLPEARSDRELLLPLSMKDVASITLTDHRLDPTRTISYGAEMLPALKNRNWEQIVAVGEPDTLPKTELVYQITLRDGTIHTLEIMGTYLRMDDILYSAGTAWMAGLAKSTAAIALPPLEEFPQVDLELLPKDYSMEDAIKDRVVVMKDGSALYNLEYWDRFVEAVELGYPYTVRCGQFGDTTFLYDLIYDGECITAHGIQGNINATRTYQHLKHFVFTDVPDYDRMDCWVLTDEEEDHPIFTDVDQEVEHPMQRDQLVVYLRGIHY